MYPPRREDKIAYPERKRHGAYAKATRRRRRGETISGRFGMPRHGARHGAFSNGEGGGVEKGGRRGRYRRDTLFLEARDLSCAESLPLSCPS